MLTFGILMFLFNFIIFVLCIEDGNPSWGWPAVGMVFALFGLYLALST